MAIQYENGSGLIDAIETGRQAARQRTEDAYITARRPIVNAYQDQAANQANDTAKQTYDLRASEEARTVEDRGREAKERAIGLGSNIIGFASDQIKRNPGMKASDALKMIPPQYLEQAGLNTPEALAAFSERHDNQTPESMLEESRWFGGADPVTDTVGVVDNETGKPAMMVIRKSGKREIDKGFGKATASANPEPGAYTTPDGIRHRADGSVVSTPNIGTMQAIAAAKGQGTTVGKGVGTQVVEDLPMSAQDVRDTRSKISTAFAKADNVQKEIDRAISQTDWTSAGVASALKGVGGAPANLASSLNTIKANIGLDQLLELKGRGGTLGQVTQAEHDLLQGLLTGIEQNQDPGVLKGKLAELKRETARAWKHVKEVMEQDLAARGPKGEAAPAAATRRKFNPATGRLE